MSEFWPIIDEESVIVFVEKGKLKSLSLILSDAIKAKDEIKVWNYPTSRLITIKTDEPAKVRKFLKNAGFQVHEPIDRKTYLSDSRDCELRDFEDILWANGSKIEEIIHTNVNFFGFDDEDPKDENPEDENPEDENPEDENPEDENPEDETPEDETPEDGTPEDGTPEDDSSEDYEMGDPKKKSCETPIRIIDGGTATGTGRSVMEAIREAYKSLVDSLAGSMSVSPEDCEEGCVPVYVIMIGKPVLGTSTPLIANIQWSKGECCVKGKKTASSPIHPVRIYSPDEDPDDPMNRLIDAKYGGYRLGEGGGSTTPSEPEKPCGDPQKKRHTVLVNGKPVEVECHNPSSSGVVDNVIFPHVCCPHHEFVPSHVIEGQFIVALREIHTKALREAGRALISLADCPPADICPNNITTVSIGPVYASGRVVTQKNATNCDPDKDCYTVRIYVSCQWTVQRQCSE